MLALWPVFAQHEHHHSPQSTNSTTVRHNSTAMNHALADSMPQMTHSFSRNLPMNRNGSGTAWMPDQTPLYAYMKHRRRWSYMLHGSVFLRYNWQNLNNNYRRGDRQSDAPNWVMGMAQRPVGQRGLLMLRAMLSLDALVMGGSGYPLLFQSGETWQNRRLVDRQHPHDLFSELSVGYTHMISRDVDVYGYLAYPGEPALGPTAFMHRISSFHNPDSPLGHHWQDATHILFGVGTVGFRYKIIKAEGSVFTGREPDEARYGFDRPRFDSYSYRISINPNANFAIQFSQGFIKSPEAIEPDEDVTRTTASVLHSKRLSPDSYWSSTLAWGLNDAGGHHKEHSLLAESNLQLNRFAVYGRYEFVQKSAGELALDELGERAFHINTLTLGLGYNLATFWRTNLNVGAQAMFFRPAQPLEAYYGKNPVSAQLFLRLTPALLNINRSSHRIHHRHLH